MLSKSYFHMSNRAVNFAERVTNASHISFCWNQITHFILLKSDFTFHISFCWNQISLFRFSISFCWNQISLFTFHFAEIRFHFSHFILLKILKVVNTKNKYIKLIQHFPHRFHFSHIVLLKSDYTFHFAEIRFHFLDFILLKSDFTFQIFHFILLKSDFTF